jgi:adenine deaminase
MEWIGMSGSDTCPTSATLSSRRHAMRVALGAEPADAILRGGRILNVFTNKWEEKEVGIAAGLIACLGENLEGKESFDLPGCLLVPGFIDAHIHLESTHLWLAEISRLMLAHGVTSVIADPHEMANVRGLDGVKAMIEASRNVKLDVFFKTPSCVPASEFEEPGVQFGAEEIRELLREPEVIGLAEMMNYPGVLGGAPQVWDKLGLSPNVDGHAPGLRGRNLQAYIAAGIGNDHETTSADEAYEKLANGMWLFIREGSAARNLDALLPALDDATWRRACFCTDDLSAADLTEKGSIDFIVRQAVKKGLPVERALTMASWNAAQAHRLENLGAIAPGYIADILALDPETLAVKAVIKRGKLMVRDGEFVGETSACAVPNTLLASVHLPSLSADSLRIPYFEEVSAIGLIDGEIVTTEEVVSPVNRQGSSEADVEKDVLKAAVIERHGKSGRIGPGFVKGLGLKRGAMASTVAHDAHNVVVVGAVDSDMLLAIRELERMGGGQVLVAEGKVLASLPLPIAGLMSDAKAEDVSKSIKELKTKARELGSRLTDPYATLSFLALSVIPRLRLTTSGLLDVDKWKIVEVRG